MIRLHINETGMTLLIGASAIEAIRQSTEGCHVYTQGGHEFHIDSSCEEVFLAMEDSFTPPAPDETQ